MDNNTADSDTELTLINNRMLELTERYRELPAITSPQDVARRAHLESAIVALQSDLTESWQRRTRDEINSHPIGCEARQPSIRRLGRRRRLGIRFGRRKLDGIPHDIVGFTALGTVVIAMATLLVWGISGPIVAAFFGCGAVALTTVALSSRSKTERLEKPPARDSVDS